MSDVQPQQEPTIEEILASIRRIISEDGEEVTDAEAAAPALAAQPEPEANFEPEPVFEPDAAPARQATAQVEDDVFDLTERLDADEPQRFAPDFPPMNDAPRARSQRLDDDDALVSEPTARRTADVLSRLAPREDGRSANPLPIPHVTLEEIVRDMLRPMLKEWLDTHLPSIVERAVEREMRRMSRRAEELH